MILKKENVVELVNDAQGQLSPDAQKEKESINYALYGLIATVALVIIYFLTRPKNGNK